MLYCIIAMIIMAILVITLTCLLFRARKEANQLKDRLKRSEDSLDFALDNFEESGWNQDISTLEEAFVDEDVGSNFLDDRADEINEGRSRG